MIDPLVVEKLILTALEEDIGFADLTTEIVIPKAARAQLVLNARTAMVIAGIDIAGQIFRRRVPDCDYQTKVEDGDHVAAGTALAVVSGPARGLLTAERTVLNLLQHLSGIATLTAQYVERIQGTRAVLIDTRKTLPGLRALEKHAAQVGGARNHRLRLDDGVLIKDNHIAICGSIRAAVERARSGTPILTKIEVECDTLEQVRETLESGADCILLDNMSVAQMREAVAMANGRVPLEASGGVRLETIRAIAETGVDFISVGRITQSAPAVDIGLDVALDVGSDVTPVPKA
jgi:nicotinate-nucleotide pyrophosphorylase (carboxylating)